MNKYLPFIDDEVFVLEVKKIFDISYKNSKNNESSLFKNAIDPFSALFDAAIKQIPLSLWMEMEKVRQDQKTLQNMLGNFHQAILGNSYGWIDLKTKNLVDIKNDKLKIIAEIKNKHNTTKGSDKIVIYDNLKYALNNNFKGYTGYYVEILPKSGKTYNIPFTPSDNKTSKRRKVNKKIRIIDGKSFYDLATGSKDSLKMLYDVLPEVFENVLNVPMNQILRDTLFEDLFKASYK